MGFTANVRKATRWREMRHLVQVKLTSSSYIFCTKFNQALLFSDIDECSSSNGGCAHNCHNSVGGHECSCRDGYALREDNRTCVDIDECSTAAPCGQTCVNEMGGFRCECEAGYALQADGISCSGIIIWGRIQG